MRRAHRFSILRAARIAAFFLLAVASSRSWGQEAEGPEPAAGFDHSAWDKLLKARVSEDGWVDYPAIRRNDAAALKGYLDALAGAKLEALATPDQAKAFWINAYNAVCIQTLIDSGLPAEVPHAVFFGQNIFKERTYTIAGKVRSLEDIEHGILRKDYKDPRIHAAIVCGASSCPRLRPEAYAAESLDRQLEEEARRWIQTETTKEGDRKNRLDREGKVLYVSKIFDWFTEDFGGGDAGILEFVKRHASAEDRAFLERNKVRIRYLPYRWTLNSR